MICENCGKEHNGSYASGRFCSETCARGFSTKYKRKEINEKVSKKLKESSHKDIEKICTQCNKKFSIHWNNRDQKFCSCSCAMTFRMKNGLASKMGKQSVFIQSSIRRSKNEIYFSELCKQHFSLILNNEPIFNGWDADVILVKEKIAILWNGKWHYEKITKKHSVEQVQNRDKIKIKEIKVAGYVPYIIKDMGKYNKEFVENEFQKFKIYAGSTGGGTSEGS